jgi:hypothetical protein
MSDEEKAKNTELFANPPFTGVVAVVIGINIQAEARIIQITRTGLHFQNGLFVGEDRGWTESVHY